MMELLRRYFISDEEALRLLEENYEQSVRKYGIIIRSADLIKGANNHKFDVHLRLYGGSVTVSIELRKGVFYLTGESTGFAQKILRKATGLDDAVETIIDNKLKSMFGRIETLDLEGKTSRAYHPNSIPSPTYQPI